jgi:hypothetical protein
MPSMCQFFHPIVKLLVFAQTSRFQTTAFACRGQGEVRKGSYIKRDVMYGQQVLWHTGLLGKEVCWLPPQLDCGTGFRMELKGSECHLNCVWIVTGGWQHWGSSLQSAGLSSRSLGWPMSQNLLCLRSLRIHTTCHGIGEGVRIPVRCRSSLSNYSSSRWVVYYNK